MVCPGQETACANPRPDSQATLLAGWWLRGPCGETAAKAPLAAVQPPMGQRKRRQRIRHNEGLQSPEKKAEMEERLQEERWSEGRGVGKQCFFGLALINGTS